MINASAALTPIEDLRRRIERWGGIDRVADRMDGRALVVLVRRDGRVEGVRVLLRGEAPEAAARAVEDAMVELVHPDGLAVRLKVPWADGLVDDPAAVLWRGGAIAQSARVALHRIGTSSQGCEGVPL